MHNLTRGKKLPKILDYYCNFHKTAQSKQFAQSGHPATYIPVNLLRRQQMQQEALNN
jgi:hypothetical protein